MALIFFDIVWDFYFSGGFIIRCFRIIAGFAVDEKYF